MRLYVQKWASKLDRLVLRIIGVGQPSTYGYVLPSLNNRVELEAFLVESFFSSEPDGTRLFVFKLYVFTKHKVKTVVRYASGMVNKRPA